MEKVKTEKTVQGVIDAQTLAVMVTDGIYNQGKARLFTFLESQFEGQRLNACKKIVDDILTDISRNTGNLIRDILGEWQIEVEAGGELTPEEEQEALREYEQAERMLD